MGLIRFCLIFLALATPASAAKLFLTTEVYPPYNLQASDGSVHGVYFDQLKTVLEDTGTSYEVVVMPWARAIALASTQAMHCVFAAARTPEREKLFKWVAPIHIDRNILVARRKANIEASSLDEAKKYRVGTQRGDYTEALLEKLGFPQVDVSADFEITLHKLKAGRIDLMPMSESTFKGLPANTFREVMTLTRQQLGLACNKSVPDEVIAKLQARLDRLIADGTQQRIFDRYNLVSP
ncbi:MULTISPECIES: transporter substrate-binding domain-containing protein [unclassified Agrobacterium]|jgi:polar amino acid transport system substrate-binding protein|uniref:substrate-binding periplasmic protein n=1 Tax=unclassified Agrobacterium TaxID=2632611 RepID=UPI002448A09E|nr:MULTISPECIES: transporter substrate-binding domain-containing protein [unclassified Agrobacterium]MDH0613979.1 transporter substrate-binding domain-containing protein [Agrobacterium sp. GD03872]MDH0696868.1 transporter substrate-binding domain-containing protein [Agrobacterium sp. GD03871]MDH1059968.1 transporter substrate-binding domain-containing protein [Agrobacterium sp. GD03992]MDH2209881.1 transporter substrate-binding domain-containing protein [Agrobacterium sp. GD03643]MDH2219380.1 